MARRIKIMVDGVVYHAALQGNALAEEISAMCPFSMNFTRSGKHEYYAALPKKAAVQDCAATMTGHRNGLYYFEGWNALSIVFKDCDTAPYKIYHVGNFDEELSALLEKSGGSVLILCETE